jgi:hypothetical protein
LPSASRTYQQVARDLFLSFLPSDLEKTLLWLKVGIHEDGILWGQMTMLLRKLTAGAVLSPAEASEEFRHGVVNCLRALLGALAPCHTLSCSCKYVSPSPFDILRQNPVALYEGLKNDEEDLMDDEAAILEECPLGFLHSQDMAAAIGHLLSLLLQV